jgi:hypothetical protein
MTDAYLPAAGLLALESGSLAALIGHAHGRAIAPATRRSLVDAGLIVAGGLDPPLVPIVDALLGDGPRLRLVSRERGRLTITDAAIGCSAAAAVLVRPPGSSALHVHQLSVGAVARHVGRTVGLGAGARDDTPFSRPLELRDWATVRKGFDTAAPSGWVGRRQRATLHEVRWAPTTGARAGTALVIACLDGGLAEIRPSTTTDGAFTVTAANTHDVWSRLCTLTSPSSR